MLPLRMASCELLCRTLMVLARRGSLLQAMQMSSLSGRSVELASPESIHADEMTAETTRCEGLRMLSLVFRADSFDAFLTETSYLRMLGLAFS